MPNGRVRIIAAIVLLGLGAAISGVLWARVHAAGQLSEPSLVCSAEGACAAETAGPFSTIAGVPLTALGAAFYASVAVLLLLGTIAGGPPQGFAGGLAWWLVAAALLAQVVLLGVRLVAASGVCTLCLATLGTTALTLAVLLPFRRTEGTLPERRLLVGGWLIASAALLATVGVGDRWMRARTAADRIQQTLDDPEKRDRYFADKAVDTFAASPVETFTLRAATRIGSDTAPIVVVEFADYLCPFCQQLYGLLQDYEPLKQGRVVFYVLNSPLDQDCNTHIADNYHPGACWMALAAACAERAGKFVPFYHAAFAAGLDKAGPEDALRAGGRAGLDRPGLERCLHSPETRAAVVADIEDAARTKAQGTPTLFIDGRKVPLWTYLDRLIEAETVRRRLPVAP